MRHALLLTIALVLASCNTGPRGQGELFMSDTQIRAKDDAECRSYGAIPGSNAYVACRMNLQNSRTAQQNTRSVMGTWAGMRMMGY